MTVVAVAVLAIVDPVAVAAQAAVVADPVVVVVLAAQAAVVAVRAVVAEAQVATAGDVDRGAMKKIRA